MNYNRNKLSLYVIIILLIFVFNWYMQNKNFVDMERDDILTIMNGSIQGFGSLRSFVIYSLIYLLFMNMVIPKNITNFIIRSRSRGRLFNERTFHVFVSSILFATCFSTVNLCMTLLFIGNEIMVFNNFYFITLLNWIAMILFYWWIGILEKVSEDIMNSTNIAIIITFVLIALSYFLDFPFWLPIKDMHVYESILTEHWGIQDVLLVYIKQIGFVIVFYLIGKPIFYEKDFIKYEK